MIIEFEYSGAGGHTITIQWYRDDGVIVEDGDHDGVIISGATTTQLEILNGNPEWSGDYYAIVTDETSDCEVETDPVEVEFPDLCVLEITTQPESQEITEGDTLTLTVVASGEVGSLQYQWYRDGVALFDGPSGGSFISGVNTDTLEITETEMALAGDYTVVVTDDGLPDCSVTSDEAVVAVEELLPPMDGLYAWYKADAQPYADGVVPNPTIDSTGNGYDLSASGFNPPRMDTSALNSMPVFKSEPPGGGFEGGILSRALIPNVSATGLTIGVVINRVGPSGPNWVTSFVFADAGDLVSIPLTLTLQTTEVDAGVNNQYDFQGYTSVATLTVPIDSWQVISGRFDFVAGVPELRTNDLTDTGPSAPGSVPFDTIQIQQGVPMEWAEALFYFKRLDDDELDQLRTYLARKWDIEITV